MMNKLAYTSIHAFFIETLHSEPTAYFRPTENTFAILVMIGRGTRQQDVEQRLTTIYSHQSQDTHTPSRQLAGRKAAAARQSTRASILHP